MEKGVVALVTGVFSLETCCGGAGVVAVAFETVRCC